MEEYKNLSKNDYCFHEKDKYIADYSTVLVVVKENAESAEISEDDFNLLRNAVTQFNATFGNHGPPTKQILNEFDAPRTFIQIFLRIPERDIHLGCLRALDLLSQHNLLDVEVLIETELAQYFVEHFNNIVFEGGEDDFTECAEIASMLNNIVIRNSDAASQLISIGLSNALIEVFVKVAPISVNEASVKYMKMFMEKLISLRNNLSIYTSDVEESIEFIMKAIEIGNEYAIERVFLSVENLLRSKADISPLFTNDDFVHSMLDFAFNKNYIEAINLTSEYLLYDEKYPPIHEAIAKFCNEIDYNSVFGTIDEIVNAEDLKKSSIAAGLLTLVGNAFTKIENIPSDFEPTILQDLAQRIRAKGTIEEKIAVSFILIEMWMHIPVELTNFIATEEELDFVFSTTLTVERDLPRIALDFISMFFDEMSSKYGEEFVVKESMKSFLSEVCDDGNTEDSEKASLLISKYIDK